MAASFARQGQTRLSTAAFHADCEAVLALRAGKGMVLDADDHDTWSVGSFFTNPVVSAEQYDLLTFTFEMLKDVLEAAGGFDVLGCYDATDESLPAKAFRKGAGDVVPVAQILVAVREEDASFAEDLPEALLTAIRARYPQGLPANFDQQFVEIERTVEVGEGHGRQQRFGIGMHV